MSKAKKPKKCVRLECEICFRAWDGITPRQLEKMVESGEVGDVIEVQSWEESINTDTTNLFEWFTHHCLCKECCDALPELKSVQPTLF